MARSLRSFSQLAGVSPATVSRIFSGRGNVAPETERRIRELAEEVGFRPSAIGRVAFGGATRSVGVLLPSLRISFFADIAIGLQRRLLAADLLPMILQHGEDNVTFDERRALSRLVDHRVDALIIHPIDESLASADFRAMLRLDLPIVIIGTVAGGVPADRVATDDLPGARQAAEHLLGLGHRRIGFCAFGSGRSPSDLRQQGLSAALAQRGLAVAAEDIARLAITDSVEQREQALRDDLRRILSRPGRPTAFFAGNDLLAVEIYRVARELGLRIPHDLSVVGFADLAFAPFLDPPLTTVVQPGMACGDTAAELAMQRLAEPGRPHREVLVPTALLLRGSTAACC